MRRLFLLLVLFAAPAFAQTRIASDFDISRMEQQLARSTGFLAQLSGRLNLGDLRVARSERSLARAEYAKALELATRERLDARRVSDLTRYATATSYAALAQAKLGRDAEAFALAEEATRYTSGSAKTWNLYASAMTVLGKPLKSIAAARNAVAIAEREEDALDLAVYRHSLATALLDSGESTEAEQLLVQVTEALRSPRFDALRGQAARSESFEIYSTAQGETAAYLSLLNRAQLRLGALYERRGQTERARLQFRRVLETRSDDATALAALARLSPETSEKERRYAEAFDANPFSMTLVREYRRHLATATPSQIDDSTTGGQMRRLLLQLHRGETRSARAALDALIAKFPANETLVALRRETERAPSVALPSANPTPRELRALLSAFDALSAEQRAALDRTTYTSVAVFDESTPSGRGRTILETGTIDGVPFGFPEPTVFDGTFEAGAPLRLTYRILGATRAGELEALLLEPLGVAP